jgi:nucleotide-binding universal stress UspA family protein
MKMLVAVDGSEHALNAVRHTIAQKESFREPPVVELVTVHAPLPYEGRVKGVVGGEEIRRYYEEEGAAALNPARRLLDGAGVKYSTHVLVGPVAESIVQHAAKTDCAFIVIATRGLGAVANLMIGSTANKVLHLSNIPVVLVK